MMDLRKIRRGASVAAAFGLLLSSAPVRAQAPTPSSGAAQPQGVLSPANVARLRPIPPFSVTGTWFVDLRASQNSFRFGPPYPKLTPAAQVHFDAARKAAAEGKVYRDDIGQCWPAGLPLIMTRVWPIAMIQMPTAIYMISGFMNSVRTIYLDGRPHTDPDVVIRGFNGESIGHWEGDTLVVDTTSFVDHHHWIDSGIPASDALHIVERIRSINKGDTLEIEYTMTDPKSWEGEWKNTKRWNRADDMEVTEAVCLPDLNDHMPSTRSPENVR
jgi:hypothetical protein